MALLEVRQVSHNFGGIQALDRVSLSIEAGEIVGLIGPNGAGKTTLFNVIAGAFRPTDGGVRFGQRELVGKKPHEINQMGISRTFQLLRTFPELTTRQNLFVGQEHRGERLLPVFLYANPPKVEHRAREILKFVGLERQVDDPAGELSFGQQRLLTLGMRLMRDSRLVLLDEPTAGVNPTMIQELVDRIVETNRKGITFLIIEHNMDVIMRLAQRIYFLSEGRVIAEGTPEQIQRNEMVLDIYYGQ